MDLGTVNFDDLFDFSPEPPNTVEGRADEGDMRDNYERERETARLNGDWSGQRHPTVRTITAVGGAQSQNVRSDSNLGGEKGGMVRQQLLEELPEGQNGSLESLTVSKGRGRGRSGGRGGAGDVRVRLERSRQSARECRARKKLRYQYLDDMIAERENANEKLRNEIMLMVGWCQELDMGRLPEGFQEFIKQPIEG